MKDYKKILAVLLIVVLAFGLAACGKGGSKASPVGKYTLSGMVEDGEETSKEDLDAMAALGFTITLELKEDNTGVLNMLGEELEITWDENNITAEGESIPYTFDGKTITLEEDGTSMSFTKDE